MTPVKADTTIAAVDAVSRVPPQPIMPTFPHYTPSPPPTAVAAPPSPPFSIYTHHHLASIPPSPSLSMPSTSPSSSPSPSPTRPLPNMPTVAPGVLPPPPPPPPRRLPPLCWTDDEAAAVTEAFRDRWIALGRVNLKAPDWQDVSNAVAARCATVKTPLQCRHKVEKLRKRYRNEKRRLESSARPRPTSWVLYQTFHDMESPSPPRPAAGAASGVTIARPPPPPDSPSSSSSSGSDETSSDDEDSAERSRLYANGNGYARFDARSSLPPPLRPRSNSYEDKVDGFRPSSVLKKRPRIDDVNPLLEVARAIRQLGESFVRVEQMKMDNAKQVEQMRMSTEWKRLEIMMETQQKMFMSLFGDAAGGVGKKQKKVPT